MPERYEPATFEQKWRDRWNEASLFRTREDASRPKFYGLDFFPYPSGAGLSVGHCRNYIPTDVLCRMKFMQGYNVLHPMGFDAFGLPAENEAIAKQTHPAPMIKQYGANYRRQMDLVGISYDWSREVYSSDPEFYRWTQWIFELLYKKGLAYRALATVNWCPKDRTVLAAEEVEGGLCWRCGTQVEKRQIPQWYFRITAYAERLLQDLDTIDWPESVKMLQRNWIGRSEGVEFDMKVVFGRHGASEGEERGDGDDFVVTPPTEKQPMMRVFTTRIDTLFGATFAVIAPEHPLVELILAHGDPERRAEIEAYRSQAAELSDIDRQATTREKTGVFTGAYAINPGNGARMPIYMADYVLMGYGTGAIMAVPGHDQRDFDFAVRYSLPIVQVIAQPGWEGRPSETWTFNTPLSQTSVTSIPKHPMPFEAKDGVLVASGEYSGKTVAEAQMAMGEWMEALGIGKRVVNYRLRDWLISRQRYWGCPIPVVHRKDGEIELVPEEQLPVELPQVDHYQPTTDGRSPLANIPEFVNVTDQSGTLAARETDTLGGFACSSWYFLRFCDPLNAEKAWDPSRVAYWMPVDCYVGGVEHAVMHLLYARFWTKVLYDEGLVSVQEPFARLQNQGQVLAETPYRKPMEGEKLGVGEEGILVSFEEAAEIRKRIDAGDLPQDFLFYRWARMSKSKGNVVTPDEMVEQFGADALRVHELFVAPFESDVQWSNDGVAAAAKYLNRVFRWVHEATPHFEPEWRGHLALAPAAGGAAADLRRATHQTIRKVGEDIERFAFNTAVAQLMTYLNAATAFMKDFDPSDRDHVLALSEAVETMILLLAPIAPFSADELWESLGRSGFTYQQAWPAFEPEIAKEDKITVAIQVNGKLRDTVDLPASASKDDLEQAALGSAKVAAHLDGMTVRKIIVVPGKLVNIVAGP